ncbi:nitronate monooxygenase [Pelodictyon phaeoclathratiforme]|jgi:NAD(P)H-dependent flavin oxidoreductase YrpB (nitropropane dioxygenase family)|uniref:2-nitropropane dioxygenase NPD n=1 Tax=Pelodictyon phaeoclathratiforme (strain DSM 5477 / BU-1) TaxID=324925 RepID=B4SEH9_PELPB|nr:nitronate monooxygenase [Pelodictyon phaeoclathratiforme]ACF43071.1 2-nitropropane dioxygenase NPD [Pelodictyon phaeoclathratiforme BU-1]MBV5289185.1 nitronate monooxygenase [Pelodictyon phaeoclathratiforme]
MNVDNFRLQIGGKEYVPIIIGGMGVNISTTELALAAAKLGGIGHISDAIVSYVCDRIFNTTFVSRKRKKYAQFSNNPDKSAVLFDLEEVAAAQKKYIEYTISQKTGSGDIFLNCMEKLTMNSGIETLKVRLTAAMDAGIDGLTLAAGLNLRTLDLIQDHPRFRDVKIGIIISSVRALAIFLKRAVRLNRLPEYIIVEGPLAGGHLGFGANDWHTFDLKTIFTEVLAFLKKEGLNIPVIPAGGIFTGTDAADYLQLGAGGVQVATRFTISKEAGLPAEVKQNYLNAKEEDIVVNMASTTGYPMRMLTSSPTLRYAIRPNCEGLGYLLENGGKCSYIDAYYAAIAEREAGQPLAVKEKTCLCTGMANYDCWTCGHTTYRLKETTNMLANGKWQLPTAEDIFLDYQFSTDQAIRLPKPEVT